MSQMMIGKLDPNLKMPELPGSKPGAPGAAGATFGDVLKDAISTTDSLQKESNVEIQKLMSGESQDLHSTLIAVQKADLSFQMMMQVRNKLVQAYQEVMRMQV
jgi:flagellar hook-basal body complex protein FliE